MALTSICLRPAIDYIFLEFAGIAGSNRFLFRARTDTQTDKLIDACDRQYPRYHDDG